MRGCPGFFQGKWLQCRARVRDVPDFDIFHRINRNRPHNVFRAMDRRSRCVQFAAERVVIGEFAMVRFGVRVSRRAHSLKIVPGQRRLVLRQGVPGRPARGKQSDCDKRRENGEGKVAKLGVVQGGTAGKLLTVIHRPASLFFNHVAFRFVFVYPSKSA